jgi:SsrA-binding protein
MSGSKGGEKLVATNRRAHHDYFVEKKIEAGLLLKGSEVKSLRDGKLQLVDSFVAIEKGEAWIHKMHIAEWSHGGPFFNHEPQRRRKLLIHKRQIVELQASSEREGYTLVPLRVYFKGGLAKVEIGLCKGKSKSDKRADAKTKDDQRSVQRAVRRSRYEDED